jgi:predicted transcriptional regulator
MSVDNWPIGQTIVKVRLMTDEETAKEGWGAASVALDLSDGTVLYASRDTEGNGPGEIFGVAPDGALVTVSPVAVADPWAEALA